MLNSCGIVNTYLGLGLSCQDWWPMWEHADLLCLRRDSPEALLGFLQHQSSLSFFSLTSWESSQWWEGYRHGPRHRRPESARWRAAASRTWETRMQWSGGSWWLWGCVLGVHLPQPPQLEGLLENRGDGSRNPWGQYPNELGHSPWLQTQREEGEHWEP